MHFSIACSLAATGRRSEVTGESLMPNRVMSVLDLQRMSVARAPQGPGSPSIEPTPMLGSTLSLLICVVPVEGHGLATDLLVGRESNPRFD